MLQIVDPSECNKSHLVHSTLEHVSLDDFTHDFRTFLSSTGSSYDPSLLSSWIERTNSGMCMLDLTSKSQLVLHRWRKIMEDNNENSECLEWDDMMEALGVDTSRCLETEHTRQNGQPDVTSARIDG